MSQKTMYSAINNSPVSTLAQNISANTDTIELIDASVLPAAPNIATIGTDENAELVLYTGISGSSITGCTRGFNGTSARAWTSGSKVYRGFTAYDHDTFRDNIVDLSSGKVDKPQGAVSGNLAQYGSNGAITDSGKKASDFATAQQGSKADTALQPIDGAIANNFAAFDTDGKPIDSGKKASDFATAQQGSKADTALQPIDGAIANNFAAFDTDGKPIDSGKKASDFATAAQGTKAASAVQNVKIGGNALTKDSSKAVDIVVNAANGLAQLDGNAKVPEILIPGKYRRTHNFNYDGMNLSTMFTETELHQKTVAADFTDIENGDYWPITLNGTVKDYATGETKTLSNAVFNLEANIQVYKQYGDTAVPNHILFCSRDLLPWAVKMRSADTTWYNDSETNPWRGSHLFQTLNAADGVLPLVAATGIGAHMYTGPNGGGMRFLLETKATGATAAVSWGWGDRGKLFLPTEREVWGQDIWSEHTWGGGAAVQWPVFAGSLKHIIKGLGNGGSRYSWWCQSSYAGSAARFAHVYNNGHPNGTGAATTWLSAPLCFLFV